MQLFKKLLAAAALATVGLCSHAQDVVALLPYSALYVFGDSLSDGGNNAAVIGLNASQPITNTYVPTQPYGLGAYTNSRVWVNSFANSLGLPAAAGPSLLGGGGGNYAYGGARTTTDGVPFPPSAKTALNGFLASPIGVTSSALYVIAVGGNDVRDVLAAGAAPALVASAAAAYASGVGDMVDALQARGAAHIIVWDAPNVGKAPAVLALGIPTSIGATSISSAFNAALTTRLTGEAGVSVFDVFGTFNTIIASPGAYGLTNVVDACGGVLGCDPSKYLFWDGIHPTSAGHALVASAMLSLAISAVPEPGSVLMMAAGLVLLVVVTRRRLPARL